MAGSTFDSINYQERVTAQRVTQCGDPESLQHFVSARKSNKQEVGRQEEGGRDGERRDAGRDAGRVAGREEGGRPVGSPIK